LRSLEDFRKNPHVKIPPKSPTIFQSLAIIKKIKFYSEKNFSFTFGPIGPAASRPIRPLSPASLTAPPFLPQDARALSPSSLRGLGVFAKSRLLFEFAQPDDDAFSLCHRQAGPTHQLHLPPSSGRSRPRRRLTSPLSATPRHPTSTSRC
jgi:hypothetical protein